MSKSTCRFPQIPFYIGFFKNEKGLGTSFLAKFCRIFDENLPFLILHKLAKFQYQTMCLVPKLFSKVYFLFLAQAFDDVVKFKILEFSRTKRAFEVK